MSGGGTSDNAVPLTARIAALLHRLAVETGDRRFRSAAVALTERRGGRPAIDDERYLDEMASLLRSGRADTVTRAATLAARTLTISGGAHSEEAVAARLRRKYAARHAESLNKTNKSNAGGDDVG